MPSSFAAPAPTVTAVITSYNCAHLLPRSIESVLSQTAPAQEVLVIDNNSQDDPERVIARYGDRVRLIRRDHNGGPSAARNEGMRAATSEWIAFLDADDYWMPEKLERQLLAMAGHPEAAVFYTDCIQMTPEGQRLQDYLADKQPASGLIFEALIEQIFVLPSTMLIRRDTLLGAAGFDEQLWGVEDMDLCLRLAHRGVRFQLVPELLTCYERQATSLSRQHARMLLGQAQVLAQLLEAAQLTATQSEQVKHRLAYLHFELAYLLRATERRQSVRHAVKAVLYRPDQLLHWKLLVSNSLRTALARG